MTTVFDKFAISDHLASTDKNCRLPQVTGKPEIKYSKNKLKLKQLPPDGNILHGHCQVKIKIL